MLDLANLHCWAQLILKGFYGWFASKLFLYKALYSTYTVKCVGKPEVRHFLSGSFSCFTDMVTNKNFLNQN